MFNGYYTVASAIKKLRDIAVSHWINGENNMRA